LNLLICQSCYKERVCVTFCIETHPVGKSSAEGNAWDNNETGILTASIYSHQPASPEALGCQRLSILLLTSTRMCSFARSIDGIVQRFDSLQCYIHSYKSECRSQAVSPKSVYYNGPSTVNTWTCLMEKEANAA
jgi:hypothetical protein